MCFIATKPLPELYHLPFCLRIPTHFNLCCTKICLPHWNDMWKKMISYAPKECFKFEYSSNFSV